MKDLLAQQTTAEHLVTAMRTGELPLLPNYLAG